MITMSEEYVTRNEFNEFMRRTEAMIEADRAREEASEARCQAQIAEIRGEVKELRVTVQDIKDTVNDLKSWRYNIASLLIGLCAVAVTATSIWLAVRGG